jgi:hypothetical protein
MNAFVHPSNGRIQEQTAHFSSQTQRFMSDVPRDSTTDDQDKTKLLEELVDFLPPPPEDQFMMTGDLFVLFLYAFTGHSVDDFVVKSVFESSESSRQAIQTLDPLHEVVHVHTPVWIDATSTMQVDQIIGMNAQQTLMNHWGPLFSSAGICSVALCSSWLLAGYFHRAFLFKNTIECDASKALQKTLETWTSMIFFMVLLALASNALVGQMPMLQEHFGCPCCLLTKDDVLFLVDSASVLFAWRFMANMIGQYFS